MKNKIMAAGGLLAVLTLAGFGSGGGETVRPVQLPDELTLRRGSAVCQEVDFSPAGEVSAVEEPPAEAIPPADEEELINQALLARSVRIDSCKITHYCAEDYPHICGNGDGLTAMGTRVMPYITCAVDPDVIPLGATVMVDYGAGELHFYVAEDAGCMKGAHIDLCVKDHQEALDLGVKRATVYWCPEGMI